MFREYLEYSTYKGTLLVFYFTGGTRAQTRREMERGGGEEYDGRVR